MDIAYLSYPLESECTVFLPGISVLKLEFVAAAEENAKLKNQIRELTKKLWLAQQGEDNAQKQVLVLGTQHKVGPFGTVKSLRTNPAVMPDEYVNPRLAKILKKVAAREELLVALANSNVKNMLTEFLAI